ncbi:filamentous hemagglutinin N-terminal domain-containing protein [Nostoc sp. XA010]|uniref:two-partner secretion domain-containing protein n=1 Tax=Nostoc sp. XA010 TaxID=2780407 RepID=UPI001E65A7BA|nr:filamentous hemagglutinin N-terminal domain-containing protein [Nostoc sp. XA010]MCC5659908.1 filamentous hemagglutinin N-terminal domain-containing protein [Nostoc sp. XA010]
MTYLISPFIIRACHQLGKLESELLKKINTLKNDDVPISIFTCMTGNNIFNIDGLVRTNGTTNLFYVNPNDIVFGSYSSLNVGGSFAATTVLNKPFR